MGFAEKLAAYACSEADILWAAKYLTLAAATIEMHVPLAEPAITVGATVQP